MALEERIVKDLTAAMKKKEVLRTSVLRLMKAAIVNKQIEKMTRLEDDDIVKVLTTLVKQRHESIDQFQKANRPELAEKERQEIRIIEEYLPGTVDQVEVERLVDETIAEVGAKSMKEMGTVMKAALPKFKGKVVDGKLVNEIVRRKLSS
ncbi:MAG: GatB/YqeY domain-containing protein [Acidobacteria bacterium]|nr:GatB/YqeY domain-containing protein [Acidobacteriota bacterium]